MNTPTSYNTPVATPYERGRGTDFEIEQEPLFE